jgi:hypothetical protein
MKTFLLAVTGIVLVTFAIPIAIGLRRWWIHPYHRAEKLFRQLKSLKASTAEEQRRAVEPAMRAEVGSPPSHPSIDWIRACCFLIENRSQG